MSVAQIAADAAVGAIVILVIWLVLQFIYAWTEWGQKDRRAIIMGTAMVVGVIAAAWGLGWVIRYIGLQL